MDFLIRNFDYYAKFFSNFFFLLGISTPSIISFLQMSLPENVERVSTKIYEEVKMPAMNANLKFDFPIVKIADLDEVVLRKELLCLNFV